MARLFGSIWKFILVEVELIAGQNYIRFSFQISAIKRNLGKRKVNISRSYYSLDYHYYQIKK